MYSDEDSTDVETSLQSDLEDVYQAYRNQQLQSRLNDIATEMEETLLQATIARQLFDTDLSVNEDAKTKVSTAQSLLRDGDIGSLGEMIDELEETVSRENTRVENEIHELRIDKYETATAMRKINEHIQVANQGQLQGLEHLFDNWDWKVQVEYEDKETFEARQEAAERFAEDMATVFVEAKELIVEGFDDDTVRRLLNALLNDERIALTELEPEEVQALTDSTLGNYLELSFG